MVIANLSFLCNLPLYETEKPYFLKIIGNAETHTPTLLKTNLEFAPQKGITIHDLQRRVPVDDAKGHGKTADVADAALALDRFRLETHGFEFVQHTFANDPLAGDAAREAYCGDMVQLLKQRCQAAYALCFDYRLRRSDHDLLVYETDPNAERTVGAPPVFACHIDHTVGGGPNRLRRHMTEAEAATYLCPKYRAYIINAWRPLKRAVEDCPIAICDPSSIDRHDLLATDRVTPDFAVEMYHLIYNPAQKWYWLPHQTPDELLLFVNYDSHSEINGTQWLACPHAAFMDADAQENAQPRESIEVRVAIFTEVESA
ncbi:hypothetical protein SCUCBS95973_008899 [Sporothrix curviconia]|uniref:Uncharacterized protein n=1 Tax=Sporothrix curviconia TaxID=1260050 RepID=A0ABP0CS15_9PEZI